MVDLFVIPGWSFKIAIANIGGMAEGEAGEDIAAKGVSDKGAGGYLSV